MKIGLYYRCSWCHNLITEIDVGFPLSKIYCGENQVDEELILSILPEDFLPVNPNQTLLAINDTGQRGLKQFKNWSRGYGSYSLILSDESEE